MSEVTPSPQSRRVERAPYETPTGISPVQLQNDINVSSKYSFQVMTELQSKIINFNSTKRLHVDYPLLSVSFGSLI